MSTPVMFVYRVLKEFNNEVESVEQSNKNMETWIANCSGFQDELYEEIYSEDMIYRIFELQNRLTSLELERDLSDFKAMRFGSRS